MTIIILDPEIMPNAGLFSAVSLFGAVELAPVPLCIDMEQDEEVTYQLFLEEFREDLRVKPRTAESIYFGDNYVPEKDRPYEHYDHLGRLKDPTL